MIKFWYSFGYKPKKLGKVDEGSSWRKLRRQKKPGTMTSLWKLTRKPDMSIWGNDWDDTIENFAKSFKIVRKSGGTPASLKLSPKEKRFEPRREATGIFLLFLICLNPCCPPTYFRWWQGTHILSSSRSPFQWIVCGLQSRLHRNDMKKLPRQ